MGCCASAEGDGGRRGKRGKKPGSEKKRIRKKSKGEASGRRSRRDNNVGNTYAHSTIDVPIVTLGAPDGPQTILKQASLSGFSDFAPASALQQAAEAAAAEDGGPLSPGTRRNLGRSSTVSFNVPDDDEQKIAAQAKASPDLTQPPPPLVIESEEADGVATNPLLPSSVARDPAVTQSAGPAKTDNSPSPPTASAPAAGPLAPSAALPTRPTPAPSKPSAARVVIQGQLYDLTPLLSSHPGGPDILRSFNGRDATKSFTASHSPNPPWKALGKYLVASAEL